MIDDCQSVIDIDRAHGGPGFDDYEKEFLESVAEWFDEHDSVTGKQYKFLKNLWDRV
jgi:hypothetical protein